MSSYVVTACLSDTLDSVNWPLTADSLLALLDKTPFRDGKLLGCKCRLFRAAHHNVFAGGTPGCFALGLVSGKCAVPL